MLRFVCIGDIHLQHGQRRNADRLQALDQVIAEGLTGPKVSAWLVLGDVFHQRSDISDRNEIAPRLQAMANAAPVVLLQGNHDAPGDLDVFAKLKAAHAIHVVTRPQVVRLALVSGAAAVFAVPYPHKFGLVSAGVEHEQLGVTAEVKLEAIFLEGVAQLQEAAAAGAVPLMIGHATIAGALSSVGQPLGLDRDIAISAPLLDRLGDIPKIFGHIHKPQELYGAHYAGSISANDWGEVERKRYLVVTYGMGDEMREGATEAGGWIYTVESIPIPTAPMYHVQGKLSRLEGFTWRVTRGPDGEDLEAPASWQGCDVRCRYEFLETEKGALDQAVILATFAEARRLELEPVAIRERAHRAPEVAAAKSLPDKIVAFVGMSGVAWSPSLAAKLAALQDPDASAFFASVQRDLSTARPADSPAPERPADTDLFEEATL